MNNKHATEFSQSDVAQSRTIGAQAADSPKVNSDAIINGIKRKHRVIVAKPNASMNKTSFLCFVLLLGSLSPAQVKG